MAFEQADRQRLTRVETRMVKLAEKLGIDVRDDDKHIRYFHHNNVISIEDIDISVSALLRFAKAYNLQGLVPVYKDTTHLLDLQVKP